MEAIQRSRGRRRVHAFDPVVAPAARLVWTVASLKAANLVGAQCRAVIGPQTPRRHLEAGKHMVGVWYNDGMIPARTRRR